MSNGAELMGAVGALAPTVFLPRPEIIHISVPLFSAPPRSCTYTCTHAFSPVRRHCLLLNLFFSNSKYYTYRLSNMDKMTTKFPTTVNIVTTAKSISLVISRPFSFGIDIVAFRYTG